MRIKSPLIEVTLDGDPGEQTSVYLEHDGLGTVVLSLVDWTEDSPYQGLRVNLGPGLAADIGRRLQEVSTLAYVDWKGDDL